MESEEESKENNKAIKKAKKEIEQCEKDYKKCYDYEKMRRTVIKGIPC